MSNKLRWYLGFLKAVTLREHKRRKTRIKNIRRADRMIKKALRRWGYFPVPLPVYAAIRLGEVHIGTDGMKGEIKNV